MNNLSPSITKKVLSTSPDVFAAVARAVLRRKGTAKLDYWFGGGRSSRHRSGLVQHLHVQGSRVHAPICRAG